RVAIGPQTGSTGVPRGNRSTSAPSTRVPGQTALISRSASAPSAPRDTGRSRPSAVQTISTRSRPATLSHSPQPMHSPPCTISSSCSGTAVESLLAWGRAGRPRERPRDDQALDVRGALLDLLQLGVSHPLLDRVLAAVAPAAERLNRRPRAPHRGLR